MRRVESCEAVVITAARTVRRVLTTAFTPTKTTGRGQAPPSRSAVSPLTGGQSGDGDHLA